MIAIISVHRVRHQHQQHKKDTGKTGTTQTQKEATASPPRSDRTKHALGKKILERTIVKNQKARPPRCLAGLICFQQNCIVRMQRARAHSSTRWRFFFECVTVPAPGAACFFARDSLDGDGSPDEMPRSLPFELDELSLSVKQPSEEPTSASSLALVPASMPGSGRFLPTVCPDMSAKTGSIGAALVMVAAAPASVFTAALALPLPLPAFLGERLRAFFSALTALAPPFLAFPALPPLAAFPALLSALAALVFPDLALPPLALPILRGSSALGLSAPSFWTELMNPSRRPHASWSALESSATQLVDADFMSLAPGALAARPPTGPEGASVLLPRGMASGFGCIGRMNDMAASVGCELTRDMDGDGGMPTRVPELDMLRCRARGLVRGVDSARLVWKPFVMPSDVERLSDGKLAPMAKAAMPLAPGLKRGPTPFGTRLERDDSSLARKAASRSASSFADWRPRSMFSGVRSHGAKMRLPMQLLPAYFFVMRMGSQFSFSERYERSVVPAATCSRPSLKSWMTRSV
mmetsp:Transcript_14490/g.43543  ORF Transcript_14490/g.43543 Transcript_14490/m.43543 type:complete len:524 (+) Transcript_14490:220-1791(+)